ncbi:MAG: hypothetical protein EB824_02920 [Thaumarchaeota archaeon S15]|nr:MAG: hypothetical protein EB824_02920 [Thaumarchaeota archaeon S15]
MAQYSEALEMLDREIAKSPHNAIAQALRGIALSALGRPGEAQEAHARAARIEPGLRAMIRRLLRHAA